jgi:hypothetical protein
MNRHPRINREKGTDDEYRSSECQECGRNRTINNEFQLTRENKTSGEEKGGTRKGNFQGQKFPNQALAARI